ncbi:MAG: oligoribonuclease [Acidimicrobiales bacterium]|jgi:oligoribonuclease
MLAWMDLEMTGLDPAHNVIVEIATIVTDDELKIVAEGPDLVINATAEQLADMDEVVVKMHTTSGLLTAITESTVTVDQAAEATLEFLKAQIPAAGTVPLCGNSIAMDRRFLRHYMPSVEEYFHYRTVDVSTVKELCKRWYRDLYVVRPQKLTAHRALDDIRESVAELSYYRELIFRTPAEAHAVAATKPSSTGSPTPTETEAP